MIFGGINKLTLLDYPDKTACILFTLGCNFKCPFCQNTSLVCPTERPQSIDASEVLAFLKKRQGLLDGVCISGGEPLMHDELGAFIAEVKALGFLVKLDTNGAYPQKLKDLVASGLIDYVAMDIKNTPEKYAWTIDVPGYDFATIRESVDFLLSGTVDYEFRTTVVREYHTCDDLLSIAEWIRGTDKYYLQKFIDSGDTIQKGLHGYSDAEMQKLLCKAQAILPATQLRGV